MANGKSLMKPCSGQWSWDCLADGCSKSEHYWEEKLFEFKAQVFWNYEDPEKNTPFILTTPIPWLDSYLKDMTEGAWQLDMHNIGGNWDFWLASWIAHILVEACWAEHHAAKENWETEVRWFAQESVAKVLNLFL